MTAPPNSQPSDDPRRPLGRLGERLALEHLQRQGYRLLARNHRTRTGEIDLVVRDARAIVFVEVKTRVLPARAGAALDAVSPGKQRRVRALALTWLSAHVPGPRPADVRFDAIGITVDGDSRLVRLDHVEGAF